MNKKRDISLVSLSLLCFTLADVRDGLGPFLGVFLQERNWSPDEIGYVMTAGGLAGMLFTMPLGALADSTRKKRLILALTTLLVAISTMAIFYYPSFFIVVSSQIVQGIMAAAIAPFLTSITLGLVGQKGLAHRIGRNEAWNHFGNFATAVLGGAIGYFYGIAAVFGVMLVMGIFSIIFIRFINPVLIDYEAARGLEKNSNIKPDSIIKLLTNGPIFVVGLILFLFHLGNAALLPLLGQAAVATFHVNPAFYTALTVVIAQVTMVPMALWAAKMAQKKGYGIVILLALLALPIRGIIAGFWYSPWSMIPVQILDGVGAGLIGVATPGIVAKILQGSGRVNIGLGFVMTLQGIGAALSTSLAGIFAYYFNYNAAFIALMICGCCAVILFLFARKNMMLFRKKLLN